MRRSCLGCLASLLALAGARPRVGLAYTRNEIGANRTRAFLKRELRNVVLSAWSVRRRETVPVTEGGLVIGQWQSVMLVDTDGPRERKVGIQCLGFK